MNTKDDATFSEDEVEAGNVRAPERTIYSDYTEVSPWNPSHIRRYKPVRKPFYKYFSGTMPDLHYRLRNNVPLLLACGLLRALGMWMGISNPVLGLFVLAASLLDSYYNVIYMCWGLLWMMIWSLVMKVPRELIYNGLYPVQGILLSLLIYLMQPEEAQFQFLLPNLCYLILLQLLNLFLFQALCAFFVKVLDVSPMMIAPTITAIIYKAVRQQSTYFQHIQLPTRFEIDTQSLHFFNGTFKEFGREVGLGIANMVFSYNLWSGFILTVGMLIVSPILGIMSWAGALIATITVVLVSPEWADVADKSYIFPSVITCGCIAGTYFVLNIHSFLVALAASALTTLVTIGLSSLFEPVPCWFTGALGAYIVTITIYCTAGSFPNLIPVELISMTTPEDHLRRYFLSKKILSDLMITKGYKRFTPDNFKSVERSILPILMCSYAKIGNMKELKTLLDLGADPNISNYNGRCVLHIAAAENQKEIVYLLLRYQSDLNQRDQYDGTALTAALQGGHYQLALYIYKKGGRIQFRKSKIASLLCYMVHDDDLTQLKAWLKCGAATNARSWHWRTPLSVAISQEKTEMIEILKKKDEEDRQRLSIKKEIVIIFKNKLQVDDIIIDYDKLQLREERVRCIKKPSSAFTVDGDILKSVIMSVMEDEVKKEALLPSLLW